MVTYEPVRTKLKSAGARQIFDSSLIPGEIVDVLVVRTSYLAASPVNARQSADPKPQPARKTVKTRAPLPPSSPHSSPPEAPSSNSLDAFVPLPVSEGLPTAAELRIVRIRLRGSDLQQYGLQAPADVPAQTMLAEFAVGEDGLPRAIRIVR